MSLHSHSQLDAELWSMGGNGMSLKGQYVSVGNSNTVYMHPPHVAPWCSG